MEKSNRNGIERVKMIKAMEFIARHINNEYLFQKWVIHGVADGDIEYGDLTVDANGDEIARAYIDDACFADIMSAFQHIMYQAYKSGGLYCDNVSSVY